MHFIFFQTGPGREVNKHYLTAAALVWMSGGYICLGPVTGPEGFYLGAFSLGIGWGVGMPVLNVLIFDGSAPRFKGLNINLSQEALQSGFLLGPIVGGWIVSEYDFRTLFLACAVFTLIALACMPLAANREDVR